MKKSINNPAAGRRSIEHSVQINRTASFIRKSTQVSLTAEIRPLGSNRVLRERFRESLQASLTAIVCLSIIFISMSCASLAKNEREGDKRTQSESDARQAENRNIVSESAAYERNGGVLQGDKSSSVGRTDKNTNTTGTGENALADAVGGAGESVFDKDVKTAALTDGTDKVNADGTTDAHIRADESVFEKDADKTKKSIDSSEARPGIDTEEITDAKRIPKPPATSEIEDELSNLIEHVRDAVPENSEEAMRASTSIDEPVVREGFTENDDDFTAQNEAPVRRTQNDVTRKDESSSVTNAVKNPARTVTNSARTSASAAGGNARGADTDSAQNGAKTTSAPGETTVSAEYARNRRTNAEKANAPNAQETALVSADTSANDTEDSRERIDSIGKIDESDTKALPSRTVHIAKNQYLDVAYPGGGWVYLGETDGTKMLSFFGKRLGDADTVFTLRAKTAGRAVLHFYKNDILTADAIDDRLEVIVEDKTASAAERITAPSYADTVPPRPAPSNSEVPSDNATRSEESALAVPISGRAAHSENGGISVSADENNIASSQSAKKQTDSAEALGTDDYALDESSLLEKAKSAYDEKNYARALALLDLFFARATSRIDEGLYLKGQTLEAKSSLQNIKGAIRAYDELLQKWPESKQWQSARRRSIYLKRMYIDIR